MILVQRSLLKLFYLLIGLALFGGQLDLVASERDSKLRPSLEEALDEAGAEDLVPVVFVLKSQIGRDAFQDARSNLKRDERREVVVEMLREHSERTSAEVISALEAYRDEGKVGSRIRALWIRNMVAARATSEVIREIVSREDVAYGHYDRPVDEEVFTGSGGSGSPTCGVNLIEAPSVWSQMNLKGRDVVVGVIDSGVCLDHPDLSANVWNNPGEVLDGTDTNGNGYVDDLHGWNFKDDDNDLTDYVSSHGTHVSGTVLGTGTNGTQTGVAPEAELMVLKIWSHVSGESTIWEAIQYGVDNGADVLNGSLGWLQEWDPDRATWRAVVENATEAGVVMIFAAGNEGECCPPHNSIRTPGDVPDAITVGATNCENDLADFSSVGPVTWQDVPGYNDYPFPPGKLKPTLVGPGVNTISTYANCSDYMSKSGTSMAAPHIAGVAALMLEANPELDHFAIKDILKDTAIDLGVAGPDNSYGSGRISAYAAVEAALGASIINGDINGDGVVNGYDLGILLNSWGECAHPDSCSADLTDDGYVDGADLGVLLSNWD